MFLDSGIILLNHTSTSNSLCHPESPTRLFHILAQGQSGREGGGTKGEDTKKNESFFMSEEPKSWRIERQFSGWAEVSAEFRVDTANIFRMVNKSVPGIHEVCLK